MIEKQKAISKLKEETKKIESEVKKQILTYLIAALSLIASLAWNEALKGIIAAMFPFGMENIYAKIIYAICVTIFVVVVTIFLSKFLQSKKD